MVAREFDTDIETFLVRLLTVFVSEETIIKILKGLFLLDARI